MIVKVFDAPCGYGKTTNAIKDINEHEDNKYIYCTPFLDEIDRIRMSCGKSRFAEPENYDTSKIDDFNKLLIENNSIAVTHKTFLNATEETIQAIRENDYILILDEVLDVIEEFNQITKDRKYSKKDIDFLLNKGVISVDEKCKVTWTGEQYFGGDFVFGDIARLASSGHLYLARKSIFILIFPPEIFDAFKEVHVLTYMFEGSMLKAYFDMFNIPYEIEKIDDTEFKRNCKKQVHIYEDKLNRKDRPLTKYWYTKATDEQITQLRNDMYNFFSNKIKVKAKQVMWTAPIAFKDKVQPKSYKQTRTLTKEEKRLPPTAVEKLKKQLSCFVSCNAKATNDFGDRSALAYCCNIYVNPMIRGLVNCLGGDIPNDEFSLVSFIQWLYRSRIRNGEPVEIFIPSDRTRELFTNWLG